MGHELRVGNNTTVNLEPDTLAETQRVYDALAEGSSEGMPLTQMFWGLPGVPASTASGSGGCSTSAPPRASVRPSPRPGSVPAQKVDRPSGLIRTADHPVRRAATNKEYGASQDCGDADITQFQASWSPRPSGESPRLGRSSPAGPLGDHPPAPVVPGIQAHPYNRPPVRTPRSCRYLGGSSCGRVPAFRRFGWRGHVCNRYCRRTCFVDPGRPVRLP